MPGSQELLGRLEEQSKLSVYNYSNYQASNEELDRALEGLGPEDLKGKIANMVGATILFHEGLTTSEWLLAMVGAGINEQDILNVWNEKIKKDDSFNHREK